LAGAIGEVLQGGDRYFDLRPCGGTVDAIHGISPLAR
jgi:hypothetical protein